MTARLLRPGVPAAGHVTTSGHWHPGPISNCPKCKPDPYGALSPRTDIPEGEYKARVTDKEPR